MKTEIINTLKYPVLLQLLSLTVYQPTSMTVLIVDKAAETAQQAVVSTHCKLPDWRVVSVLNGIAFLARLEAIGIIMHAVRPWFKFRGPRTSEMRQK